MSSSIWLHSWKREREGCVKCLIPQNPSGVSGVNRVRAESNTTQVNRDQSFRRNKTTDASRSYAHTEQALAQVQREFMTAAHLLYVHMLPGLITPLWVELERRPCGHLMTPQEPDCGMLCFHSVVLLRLKKKSPVTSVVSDSAATVFTPWDSRSFLWTQTLHPLHQSGE